MTTQKAARASPELRKAPLSPRYSRNYTTPRGTRHASPLCKIACVEEMMRKERPLAYLNPFSVILRRSTANLTYAAIAKTALASFTWKSFEDCHQSSQGQFSKTSQIRRRRVVFKSSSVTLDKTGTFQNVFPADVS